MKICILTENISSVGGVQRVVTRLASELAKDNEITVVSTLDKSDKIAYEFNSKVILDMNHDLMNTSLISRVFRTLIKVLNKKINLLNKNNMAACYILQKIYYPKKTQKKFVTYINDNQYDVVIGAEGYFSILLGVIKNQIDCKIIGWQHNSYEAYFENKGHYYWNQDILFKNNLSKLDEYVVLTNHDQKKIKEKFNIDSKVIHNPISFSSTIKSNVENKKIIALGRFTAQKGFDQLIEAYHLIAASYPEWSMELYGSGKDEEKLKNLITKYNLQNQVFLHPPIKDVRSALVSSSIYALPSRWEGFGLVVTEALECGVPVIAFQTTGPSEILERQDCGILVENGDIVAFSKGLKAMMDDIDYRKKLSTNAVKRAEAFSSNHILKLWDDLMRN